MSDDNKDLLVETVSDLPTLVCPYSGKTAQAREIIDADDQNPKTIVRYAANNEEPFLVPFGVVRDKESVAEGAVGVMRRLIQLASSKIG